MDSVKRSIACFLTLILTAGLCGCGTAEKGPDPSTPEASSWQEQYDLGLRYLSEGSYENAVIAFAAAIEIDRKRPESYAGLANSYIELGQYEKARQAVEDGKSNCGEDSALTELDTRLKELLEGPAQSDGTALGVLELSNVSIGYTANGEAVTDEGSIVGDMEINCDILGPANTYSVRIATWFDVYPSQEEINSNVSLMVNVWKKTWKGEDSPSPLPFSTTQSRPVYADELGKTSYVLLVGLDRECNAVGYALAEGKLPSS